MRDADQPREVLLRQRTVQSHLLSHRQHLRVTSEITEKDTHGISGHRVQQCKHQRRGPDRQGKGDDQPAEQVLDHARSGASDPATR